MAVRTIAIACQGGGTHAAFTWGVLTEILRTQQAWDSEPGNGDTFKVVAISGTSAGALNALAAWYGLVPNSADPACGSAEKAIERLDFLWTTFAATTFAETMHNSVVASLLEWKAKGAPFPGFNPYHPHGNLALAGLEIMGARPEYLGFPGLLAVLCPDFASIDWPGVRASGVRMIAGAIEVLSGNFEIFDSDKTLEQLGLLPGGRRIDEYDAARWRMRRPISLDGVAASGTLPEVLPAQRIPEATFPTCEPGKRLVRDGMYWDGLFSQNPPVRDLLDHESRDEKPDEIWVVRINPQETYPESMDLSLEDIRDRENALAGRGAAAVLAGSAAGSRRHCRQLRLRRADRAGDGHGVPGQTVVRRDNHRGGSRPVVGDRRPVPGDSRAGHRQLVTAGRCAGEPG